ncbi:MAG: hypothetical protein ABJH82_12510 [Polaribacter sp.]|uniref:hypothetical protein n=1 Tax=Polaribacter sp. TaxID=1920175 RepID=UPI003265EF76
MKKQILNLGKALNKAEQKQINGGGPVGIPIQICAGTGVGGHWNLGHSEACIGQESGTKCTINGYLAACTGSGDGFWFY